MSSSHLFLLLSPPGCAETVGSTLGFPFRNDLQEDFPKIGEVGGAPTPLGFRTLKQWRSQDFPKGEVNFHGGPKVTPTKN